MKLLNYLCCLSMNYSIIITIIDGRSTEKYDSRTWGGHEITVEDAPYIAIVNGICTGSIVHDHWIMTAAHCIKDHGPTVVAYGTINVNITADRSVRSDRVIVHPKYNKVDRYKQVGYDLALIFIEKPIKLSNTVQIIKLDGGEWPEREMYSRSCTVEGFGYNIYNNFTAHRSHFIAGHGENACDSYLPYKEMVCVQGIHGDGICDGDSGGPMICDKKQVAVTSSSIASNGDQCGNIDELHMFTFLCPKLDWIKQYVDSVPAKPPSCSSNRNSIHILLFIAISLIV